jgi:elongation factor 1-alpha
MLRYPIENEDDNIEYKRYLLDREKFWGYSTQMNARLIQGKEICGIEEAYYFIGLDDEGTIACISNNQLEISDKYFKDLCNEVNAKIISKEVQCFDEGNILKYHIKRIHKPRLEDIKLALLGDSGVGKSTIVSVLTYNDLDDGKGTAKKEIFRHLHEIKSGLTSSITYGIIGIKKKKIVNV